MTNGAAIGYALLAAKRSLGLAGDKLVQLEAAMREEMDVTTEEEAERAYNNN